MKAEQLLLSGVLHDVAFTESLNACREFDSTQMCRVAIYVIHMAIWSLQGIGIAQCSVLHQLDSTKATTSKQSNSLPFQ